MALDIGTGASITFSSSFFSGLIKNISISMDRVMVDSSNMATTGGHTYVPGDLTNGTMTVTAMYDPAKAPPITGASETVTMLFPTSALSISFPGMLKSIGLAVPLEDLMVADFEIQINGLITFDITP